MYRYILTCQRCGQIMEVDDLVFAMKKIRVPNLVMSEDLRDSGLCVYDEVVEHEIRYDVDGKTYSSKAKIHFCRHLNPFNPIFHGIGVCNVEKVFNKA